MMFFSNALANADWSSCLNRSDVDIAWEAFRDTFLNILDGMAPFKEMRFDNLLPE